MTIFKFIARSQFGSIYDTRAEMHFNFQVPSSDIEYAQQQHVFSIVVNNFTSGVYDRQTLANLYRQLYTKSFTELFTDIDMIVFNLVFQTNAKGEHALHVEYVNHFDYTCPFELIKNHKKEFAPLELSFS